MGEGSVTKRVCSQVEKLRDDVYEISKSLYENPETNYKEKHACQLLTEYAARYGFDVKSNAGGIDTAFRASRGGASGGHVALLLEYDALPEVGHGCGHNLMAAGMTAAAVAAAEVLDCESDFSGKVSMIGTPAEEGGLGKYKMLDAGVFDDVDITLQFHPSEWLGYNKAQLAAQGVHISYSGKPAHSTSCPWDGVNALDAVMLTFSAINARREHLKPDMRISGVITDGGGDIALVPPHASAHFRVRGYEDSEVRQTMQKLRDCADAAALATGAVLKWEEGAFENSPLINDTLVDLAARCGDELNMDLRQEVYSGGTSDFGKVSRKIPSLMLRGKCWPEGTVSHSKDAADKTLEPMAQEGTLDMARVLALMVIELLTDDALINDAYKEFEEGQ